MSVSDRALPTALTQINTSLAVKKIDAVEGTEMTEWYSCRQGGVSFGKS
jgi:hypothetical protein